MSGFVNANLSFNWLTRRLQTIRKKSNERTSKYLLHKERCIKEQIFCKLLCQLHLVHQLSSQKEFFSSVKFRAKFEVVLQKQFLPVDRCESLEIRLFYCKLSSR